MLHSLNTLGKGQRLHVNIVTIIGNAGTGLGVVVDVPPALLG